MGLILSDALILTSAIESLSIHNIVLTRDDSCEHDNIIVLDWIIRQLINMLLMLILSIALDCIHLNESFFCDKFIAIDNSFTTDYSIFYI